MNPAQRAAEAAHGCAPIPVQGLTFCAAHPHEEYTDEGCPVAADAAREGS